MVSQDLRIMTKIEENTVIAVVAWYGPSGDEHYTLAWKPGKVGKHAHVVGHPDHKRLLDDVVKYFDLTGPVDYRPTLSKAGREDGPTDTADINHPVIYTPVMSVYDNPRNVWTVRLKSIYKRNPTLVHVEDEGELAAQVREVRNILMADAATAAKTPAARKKAESAEPKVARGPVVKTVKDLPLDTKPHRFEVPGLGEMEVKVFGKTHREKMGDEGKRVPDPETPRTAKDDSFTYAATAYQLGKVKAAMWVPKGLLIVGANGVAILQTIRPKDKDEVVKVQETMAKNGFKGEITSEK